jgi:hypothetical protein
MAPQVVLDRQAFSPGQALSAPIPNDPKVRTYRISPQAATAHFGYYTTGLAR